jgi:uncharacterized protein YxjI
MIGIPIQYPLTLSFKFFALAPQFSVSDDSGRVIAWAAQKLFRLKEAVNVFSDSSKKEVLFTIKADRVMDFGARYHFTDGQGQPLGSVQRQGMRSIWRAQYDIVDPTNSSLKIREENPWIKVADGLLGALPLGELFTGFVFHPAYLVSRPDGTPVVRIKKKAAFLESRFSIERMALMEQQEEQRILLSLIMLVLLERRRG